CTAEKSGLRFSKSYSEATPPRLVKSPNRYWPPAPVAMAVGMMQPTRPTDAVIRANSSANRRSVCSELTPGTVRPLAHSGYNPELLANRNVDLTLRRAARWRAPSSGFSRCQAKIRARRLCPVSKAIDGSTTLKYFLSSKSTLSHGGLPSRQVKPPDQPVAESTAGSASSGTRNISGNSRCQWKKAYSDFSLALSVAGGAGGP